MKSYSFQNVVAAIAGPGLALSLGAGAGNSEEGIDIDASEDKNVMTIGADGQVMHTLIVSDGGLVTMRFLKTSPINGFLQIAYNLQKSSSSLWGQNLITVADKSRNELNTAEACAFKKKPKVVYGKTGEMLEWTFDVGTVNSLLGTT